MPPRNFSKHIQGKADDAGDSRKILVQGKERGAVFGSDRRNQGIRCRYGNALRTGCSENPRSLPIRWESLRFEDFPLRKIMFDATYVALEPLQDFGDDNPSERKRLRVGGQA